jgi:hypothetical protein
MQLKNKIMFTKADIEKYFNAEKAGSWMFISIGIAAVIAAIVFFFFIKSNVFKGAAIPFLLIGLIMGIIGFTVYLRSDADRLRNVYAYDMNPSHLKDSEMPRMEKVMKNFVVLRWVEIVLFLTGAALYIYFIRDIHNDFWRGLGLALVVMAVLALTADYFAEKRGHIYLTGLKSFVSK